MLHLSVHAILVACALVCAATASTSFRSSTSSRRVKRFNGQCPELKSCTELRNNDVDTIVQGPIADKTKTDISTMCATVSPYQECVKQGLQAGCENAWGILDFLKFQMLHLNHLCSEVGQGVYRSMVNSPCFNTPAEFDNAGSECRGQRPTKMDYFCPSVDLYHCRIKALETTCGSDSATVAYEKHNLGVMFTLYGHHCKKI